MESEIDNSSAPPLPEPIILPEEPVTDQPQVVPIPRPIVGPSIPSLPFFYFLPNGCYFAQWIPSYPLSLYLRFNGVVRIERQRQGVTASGDFYSHLTRKVGPAGGLVLNPDPDPKDGIPIFPRRNYLFYLRITQVLEYLSTQKSFTLGFERHLFNRDKNTWDNNGEFSARMTFKSAPSNYHSGSTYLEGQVKSPTGGVAGYLRMGRVSNYLRKATLEVDRVSQSEYPVDNGSGVDWKDVYNGVDWDVNVYESETNLVERSGESWSDGELHAEMLERRDSADLDKEWRYHLLCVRRLDSTSRGIMYDAYGGDSNNIPREGAGISSHWVIPNRDPPWGTVAGQRFGAATAPYFRTAVHEIGHAMGLYHNTTDTGFMNTTNVIAASPGTFPANVQWTFNMVDERCLRHMPDPWVRPGMIPFGRPYKSAPISPVDRLDLSDSLSLAVKPLLPAVPIGAPVRLRISLRNTTDAPMVVPASLCIKSGHVYGSVVGPGGSSRGFQSVMRCVDEPEHQTLEPDAETSHDVTLLRGHNGALFEASGVHEIKVDVIWEADDTPLCVRGSAAVMIQPAMTQSHAEAALKTLSTPDLLLTLALGGDHLKDGVEALQAALADDTLAPHYKVIEAKRLARRFRTRGANPSAALKLLTSDTVMSPCEAKRMAGLVEGVAKRGNSAVEVLKKSAAGDMGAEEIVNKLL